MAGKQYLFFQNVTELLSNCCNSVQTWVPKQVAGFLVRKLGAMRNTFVTDESL